MKKQAQPQRVSPGVYRQAGGNLRQMQAPRPRQQRPPMRAQPMPQGQMSTRPMPVPGGMPQGGQQMPQQQAPQQLAQWNQMPQAQAQQGFAPPQGMMPPPQMQAPQMPPGFNQNLQQPDWNQMAQNDMRSPTQYGQGPLNLGSYQQADPQRMQQMQQAMQYYQQNPQAMQQTQQGMQTLMPQAARQILGNAGAGLMSMPPGRK